MQANNGILKSRDDAAARGLRIHRKTAIAKYRSSLRRTLRWIPERRALYQWELATRLRRAGRQRRARAFEDDGG